MSHRKMQLLLTITAALFIGACASKIKPADISATANPTAEVDSLAADLQTARTQRVDVLAPESFRSAENKLEDAKEKRAKGKKGEKIIEDVRYGRAFLNRATNAATRSQKELTDVMKAREQAISGGAEQHPKELQSLDKDLKKYTVRIEEGKQIDRSDLTELQTEYLDLELKSIKTSKLSEAKNTLENAEKDGAKKWVPKVHQEAVEKLHVAEQAIETDRHNQAKVNQTSLAAVESARRTMTLLKMAKESDKRSPEQIAQDIEIRNAQLIQQGAMTAAAQSQVKSTAAQLSSKEQQLASERTRMGAQLTATEKERAELAKRDQFNKVFESARAEFGKDEADVYRQGDNMIIRLKSMKFSPGRSDLPSASMPVLNKVKGVIGQLETEDIMVEGHTDSTGTAELNKRLSSERAAAVAEYFKAEKAAGTIESAGFGYEKPIASNKSKAGREMNRRVDIVVKPSTAANTATQPETGSGAATQ